MKIILSIPDYTLINGKPHLIPWCKAYFLIKAFNEKGHETLTHFSSLFEENKRISILKRIQKYKNIIENIRSLMPDASITADAIVAFPGETEQQYQDTLKLISEIGFDQVNTAAYSPRPNTPAAVWTNQLSEEVKKTRLKEINDLVEKTALIRNQRYINNIESVLIEGLNPKNSSQIMGRTRTNRLTFVEIPKNINFNFSLGDEINVRINEARPFSLTGELSL